MWSDIPNDEMPALAARKTATSAAGSAIPSGNSNGNTFDYQGRQISFCHGTRRVIRYEHDGTDHRAGRRAGGKELNAPNDGAVHPDGWLFFTDPGYGSLMDYEGNRLPASATSPQPIQKEAIYRVDAPGQWRRSPTSRSSPTGCASRRTTRSATSPIPASRTTRMPRA